jgi:hypothetical protein
VFPVIFLTWLFNDAVSQYRDHVASMIVWFNEYGVDGRMRIDRGKRNTRNH